MLDGDGVVSAEEVFELRFSNPDGAPIGRVPRLLLALNSGRHGTIHANSAREVLVKLCTLPLLAGENISLLSAFKAAGLVRGRPAEKLAPVADR
ncbi:MAG: hypothetical protein ABI873_09225, partial [Marmoricola sp.]